MCIDTDLINLDALIFLVFTMQITNYFLFILYYVKKKKNQIISVNSIHSKMMNGMQGNVNCISH